MTDRAIPVPAPSPQGDGDSGYDQRRVDAQLITCTVCQREYYMTSVRLVCLECQWKMTA